MKKAMSLLTATAMAATLLAGCGGGAASSSAAPAADSTSTEASSTAAEPAADAAAEDRALRRGALEPDVSLRLADRRARCAAVSQKREPRILGGHRGAARAVLRRAVRHSVFFYRRMADGVFVVGLGHPV